MLNKKLHLNINILTDNCPMRPTRDGYGEGLLFLGQTNPNVVALCADLAESTRTLAFAESFPDRFFEVGVAEQNLATVAAGLGISGKIPYIASYATFSPGRNYEQIRTTIAYNNSNVKIIGAHAGVSVGPDGATHQATEDVAIMRVMPNMRVFVPCDAFEAKKATIAASQIYGPVYIRLAREKSPELTTEETPFVPGKAQMFFESKKPDVTIIACGILLSEAIKAAQALSRFSVEAEVLAVSTIVPLDEGMILKSAKRTGAVVTVEEHQVRGGLGGAVAELLARSYPVPIEFVGLHDTFGESGPALALMEKYGLTQKTIMDKARRVVKRKVIC